MEILESRFNHLEYIGKIPKFLIRLQLISIPLIGTFFILDIPFYFGKALMIEQYFGIFFTLVIGNLFILYPLNRKKIIRIQWYDLIMYLLSFIVGLYITIFYPKILFELGKESWDKVILGTIAIFLILEGIRRIVGWMLVGLGLFFILYARFSWIVPGIFHGPGISWERLSTYLFLDPSALFGLPMAVTAAVVMPFILFGNLLFGVGGGELLNNIAMAGFGRFRGGPAKIAVVASSLFGTISGTAVSNVVATGTMTIPLMKKIGYRPHIAGAIEAVASTGGQLMPPVMGVTAFIMADFTGIPYPKIAIAALIPSILYYASIFFQVDLEAGKMGLSGIAPEELPPLKGVLKKSWLFFIPIAVLIYTLFVIYLSPGKSALIASLSIVLISFFQKETRLKFSWIAKALEDTGSSLLELGVIVALAGLIIGVINYTGIGFILTMSIVELSGGNIYFLLIIVAIIGLILGMGMPTAAVYVLLAVLLAPSLIKLGISVMAAHLFIQYVGMLSLFTPPIAFAAFTAASIAGADPMQTGWSAMRLGILIYIVPFLFVFSPALLSSGPLIEIILATTTALFGCFMLSIGLTGFLFKQINIMKRILMTLSAVALLIPASGKFHNIGLLTDIFGAIMAGILLFLEFKNKKDIFK
ncbi:TPA: TRAP transporter fused permease subunit [Candidatus Poribacteria bacterium]|nr:TRAP transporter fused permease subunit [Candidatus Poribacteria bacterium]